MAINCDRIGEKRMAELNAEMQALEKKLKTIKEPTLS